MAAEVDAIVAADEAVARVITGCIAAKGNVLITSNVNALRVEGDQVTIERGVAEGSSIQTLKAQRPAIALIGESVDEIDPGNEPASIQQIEVSVPDALPQVTTMHLRIAGLILLKHNAWFRVA